jgi:hypothetical protein
MINPKQKKILIFVMIVGMTIGIMNLGYYLMKETPTQALCDDLMEMMTDPMHNTMHTNYVETMYLLHGYIGQCHDNGMYEDMTDYDQFQP